MEVASKAIIKDLRISHRKMIGVVALVRGKKLQTAIDTLTFCNRRGAVPVLKLIKSAMANATQKSGVDVDNLYIKTILVNQGPTLKRSRPRSRGMANPILKRTSHVTIELAEK